MSAGSSGPANVESFVSPNQRHSVRPRAVPRSVLTALAVVLIAACSTVVDAGAPARAPQATPESAALPANLPLGLTESQSPTVVEPVPARLIPSASPVATAPPAPLEPFAMNLFGEGDFVAQYTFEWCVAASVQMTWNMVNPDVRTARDDQQLLWERARELSNNPYRGADPGGWSSLLNELGIGPYELVSLPTYEEALRVAATAMHDTNRPVGLVMWRGRHAWTMSGFESMGEPSVDADFQVTGVRVVDPLYPYGSGTWGPSPQPNQLLSPEELAIQFVFREQRRWSAHIPSGWLLVLPVAPASSAGLDVTGGPGSHPRDRRFEEL
jgi:hypothetical protein